MVEKVNVSVRNLVEFILRSGDIDNTRGNGYKDFDVMQEGSRIHRKIQKSMPSSYTSEVALKIELPFVEGENELFLTIEGRADGIWYREEKNPEFWIDEIKTMYLDLNYITEPIELHLAQAKCYAYIYAIQQGLETIGVQLTYCNIETEVIKRFERIVTIEELKQWFETIVKEYAKWLFWQKNWIKKRNKSMKELVFPFTYRPGQKEFVAGVYRSILREKKLFVEAPTGVGKTISTIFPAVKAMGEGLSSRFFYLTAKTMARTVAEDTFSLLMEQGMRFRFVTITSKEKICVLEKPECNPEKCPRAKGHFDRVNEAVFDMLTQEETITRTLIEQYAQKHMVCPFEMCLDVAVWADAVICDYNYVFDPNVSLKRFFAEDKKQDIIFLIDEAHNLVERAREMYSAEVTKEQFLLVKRLIHGKSKSMEKQLDNCNSVLLRMKRECEDFKVWENIGDFIVTLMQLLAEYEDFLKETILDAEAKEAVLTLYFEIRRFLAVYECIDLEYKIYTDYTEERNFRVKLLCMEPSKQLKERLQKGRSAILFSATLLPIGYYKEQLGGEAEDYAIYVPSPFQAEKRLLMIGKDVSTKYTRRTKGEFEKIARYLDAFVSAKVGNYFVFLPSYQMLEKMVEVVTKMLHWKVVEVNQQEEQVEEEQLLLSFLDPSVQCYVQQPMMTEAEKEQFLQAFSEQPSKRTVGFCVMGGIFGEGIDLKNDRLIGTVIVGTGLPMLCHEKELFKTYFDEKNGKGFEYAYLYPGMNKVMQSAGRVIRTMEDVGAILLLEERFVYPTYQELFPREWFPHEIVTVDTMKEKLEMFWN